MLRGWIDYLVMLVVALGALSGLRRGFTRVVFDLLGLAAGLAAAWFGTRPLVGWLGRLGWEHALAAWLREHMPLSGSVMALPVGGKVPFNWGEGMPPALRRALQERSEALFASGYQGSLGGLLSEAAAHLLLSVLVFAVLWMLAQTAVNLLGAVLSGGLKAAGLSVIDRVAGAAAGAVRNGVVVAATLCLVWPFAVLLGGAGLFPPGGLSHRLATWFSSLYPWLVRSAGAG